jgi:hypothetical protein
MKVLATLAIVAAVAVAVAAASAGAQSAAVKAPIATASGVDGLRLARTIDQLRALKLIGGARKGCELAPGERVAPLKAPLQGFAHFYPGKRLSSVTITAGAETAAGIGIGDGVGEARAAYPKAPYDPPHTVQPFPQGFVWIGGERSPKMTLVIDPYSHLISEIAIPSPNFCE